MIQRILTVCTGNICRSPLAEVWLQAQLPDLQVTSAGVGALVGHGAAPNAQDVAADAGLDLSAHQARQVNVALVGAADLILVMDDTHVAWLKRHHPTLTGRIFLLGQWRNRAEVADPFQQPRDAFDEAFARIRDYGQDWVDRVRSLNGGR
ncbi:low molecular weight protein-tyrosine-phosphatase [Salinisphaera sp. P385]|uniref:protein-tyrosine-phosphatase n=1 Tax=Spectribacter acetivorans TaxID=3075603 RepID=A0ABU3BBM8_9GAMM|nr:low molecular weight protein-tyrosine-phosphatase [Salinisphaera sp. P385]MDT0619881.1 low molecular weight protein-tyrosine-phosphatase [Salinisphaera sp. P385]